MSTRNALPFLTGGSDYLPQMVRDAVDELAEMQATDPECAAQLERELLGNLANCMDIIPNASTPAETDERHE